MKKTKKIAFMGLMLAMVLVFSYIEHMLPVLPMLPPGVNLGLSNIITMYCAFFIGGRWAFGMSALKSLFVFSTRGLIAGFLSLCGGLLSVFIVMILIIIFKQKISYIATSICGAVAHNIGQILAVSTILTTGVFYYIPVLIVSGIIMGSVTGITLSVLLPVFHNVIGSENLNERKF